MAPQRNPLHRGRDDIVLDVEKEYDLIIPKDEDGVDRHILVYGRSLLVVSEQVNNLQKQINETKLDMAQTPLGSPQNSDDDSSQFDSTSTTVVDMSERLQGHSEEFKKVHKRLQGHDDRFDRIEERLQEHSKEFKKLHSDAAELKVNFERLDAQQHNRQLGNPAARLKPVPTYIPGQGVIWPDFFPTTGGELFKLREDPEKGVRMKVLTYLAHFYDIEGYERWGQEEEEWEREQQERQEQDQDSAGDKTEYSASKDSFPRESTPLTLEEAVQQYPERVFEELLPKLGVIEENYIRFRERAEQIRLQSELRATKRRYEEAQEAREEQSKRQKQEKEANRLRTPPIDPSFLKALVEMYDIISRRSSSEPQDQLIWKELTPSIRMRAARQKGGPKPPPEEHSPAEFKEDLHRSPKLCAKTAGTNSRSPTEATKSPYRIPPSAQPAEQYSGTPTEPFTDLHYPPRPTTTPSTDKKPSASSSP